MAPARITCCHILIKTQNSRRPQSWRDPQGLRILNTTQDQAIAQMSTIRENILNGQADFRDVASQISDCGSAQRGGDLGEFGRGDMQLAFEEAAFALNVGEISPVIVTDSGVHIIYRMA